MPNESVATSDQPAAATPSLRWGRITVIAAAMTTALAVLLGGAAVATAQVCSTTAYATSSAPPSTDNWTDTSALWNPSGGFPGCALNDSATDNASTTIIVNTAIPNSITGLIMACSSCTIDIQSGGQLTLTGAGSIGNGATPGATLIVSGGTLTIASGGSLTFQSGAKFQVTAGTVDIETGGQVTVPDSVTTNILGAALVQLNGGTLTIPSAATLALQNTAELELDAGIVNGDGTINNFATVQATPVATVSVNAVLNNLTGNVNVVSGVLSLTEGGSGDGPFTILAGGTLDFSGGTYTMTNNGVVTGAGTLQVDGATLSIGGVTSPGGFVMSSGTLTGAGFLSVINSMTWSGGTLTGSGGAELAGHGIGTIDGANGASSPMVLDGRSFNNYGTITFTPTTSPSYPLLLSNGAAFNTFGSFYFNGDGSITGGAPASFNVFPNGIIGKTGGSLTSTINPALTNSGSNVSAYSGTLELAGNTTSIGGFFYSTNGATLKFSGPSSTFDSSSYIFGDANFTFSAGTAQISGGYNVGGTTDICGATVDIETFAQTSGFKFTYGTLIVDDDFTMYGTGTWSGGTMGGNADGFFDVAPGATLTIDAATGFPTDDYLYFENDGTVNYTADPSSGNYLKIIDGGFVDNFGLFDIRTDAPIVAGVSTSSRTNPSALATSRSRAVRSVRARSATAEKLLRLRAHALCGCPNDFENENSGTLQKSLGTGTTDFGPVLDNSGAVNALTGTMSFLDTYDQTAGSTTLGPGNIQVSSPLTLVGGTLNGAGTITGDVTNNGGDVAPGGVSVVGTINITGDYTQTSTGPGVLDIELASASSYDVLAVGGNVALDGTLNVSLLSGYQPANGDTFKPLTFTPAVAGDFATKNTPTWAAGHGSMTSSYVTGTGLVLTAVITSSSADLSLSSAGVSGPASVNSGAALSYTVSVTNNGPDPSSGTVTVVDTLPASATAASGSGSGWTCGLPSGGIITCTSSAPIVSGGSFPTLTFSMTAPANGGSVTDSATVTSSFDSVATNNTNSVTTNVVAQADLSITKTGPTGVTAGQDIVYTVIVTNNGPSSAVGVQVNDPTPANLTFVSNSSSGGCTTAYPCNLGTLTSGQSVTITSTYSTSPIFSGNVTNVATVSETTSDPNSSNDSVSAITNVGAQADLSVVKTGPASTNPGQNITYTIVVHNAGPSPATLTTVSDPTPVGVAFISNTGACSTPYPCSLGTLAFGQNATITTTYSVPSSYSGGAIINTASVSSSVNDPNNTDNSSTVTTTVGASADVGITKTGPASVSLGQNIVYTITVSDGGPATASGVVVSDPTPAGLTFVSASGGGCTTFPCTIGALAVGPQVTITATFNVPANYAGAPITNTASVSSASDSNAANNTASVTTTVASQADVSITKTGPPSVTAGSTISYTITVNNTGVLAAANTFVNDATPAGLTFVSNSGACSGPYPCALGTINPNSPVVITSTYNVPANYGSASITNTATVSTSSPDSNPSNNTSTATTPISGTGISDLAISKTGPGDANPNGTVAFTIIVGNKGPSTANNVVITDPTPAGLSFISNSGGCTTPFPCTIASIGSGQFVEITSHYFVTAQSGSITNTASVSTSSTDPVSGNNSSSATITISSAPVCPPVPALTSPLNGATVASPITLSWNGSADATGYTVTITGAASKTFSTTSSSITTSLDNGTYSWTVQASGTAGCPASTSLSSSFTVCNSPGLPVPSVVGLTTTGQTYTVEWTPTEGTTAYELQEALDAAFNTATSTTVAGTSMSFTKNVQNPTAFFYRVRASAGCSQTVGSFSAAAPVIIVPLPALGSINPNVPIPAGSTQPVTFPIHVDGLPGVTTSFVATVDKPWLAVTPSSGIMPPEGVTFTISADPTSLQNGTWTGTVIIVFGSTGVSSRVHIQGVAPKTSIPVSISLTTPVSPATLSSPSATAVVIPSVGHLAGFDTQWQSDIRVANITSLSKKVQLTFSGGSATSSAVKQTTITIDPNATTALDDIVRNWYGVGAMGDSSNGVLTVQPLDASGKPDLSVSKATVSSSRTYNASAVGTLGQFIPGVPLANFISTVPGASTILALQQIAQSDTFRTNLGLVEATGKPASVLISVFDGGGSKLLDLPESLAAGEQRQLNSFLANNGVSLTNGHIEVQATGGEGKVTAYASVIDDRTTDPLLVSGVPIGGVGASRFVIPGVANLDTGASWRSDVRIFNSGLTPQTTTLTLYPTGNPSASTSSAVTIQPGEVKALDDIVQSTFNLTNAGGALHVTTTVSAPLVVTARTYDDTANGTLGQFVQAVTPADAVGSGDRSLQLLQMEDSPRYRTNLGLAEVTGQSVTAEVTVILPDSKVAPKVQIPLAAFEYRQFPIISSLGLGNTYNARISVRVIDGQGKITAYGSVIDQVTQDPTYVPAQ